MKKINNIHFVFDVTKKNIKLKKIFLKKYKNYSPRSSNVIVVFGGDGFMLHTLKKYKKYNKPFYGVNTGTFGFLMNRYKNFNIKKSISKAKISFVFIFFISHNSNKKS